MTASRLYDALPSISSHHFYLTSLAKPMHYPKEVYMKLPFMAKKPNIEPEDLKSLEKIAVNKEWYEKSSSTSFVNLPLASRIFEKLAGDSPVSIFGLYANHSEQYQKLWGKCSFAYPGEYYARAWVMKLTDSENVILFSSKGGGSSFEVTGAGCDQWPPTLSDEAEKKLVGILLAINNEMGAEIRKKYENDFPSP